MEQQKSRTSVNLSDTVFYALKDKAAREGRSIDYFILSALEEASSWTPQGRAAIFVGNRPRENRLFHYTIKIDSETEALIDEARTLDWIETGQSWVKSQWINLALNAVLAGGLEGAARGVYVPALNKRVRKDIIDNPRRYDVRLDNSGSVPSQVIRSTLTARINPTVVAGAKRQADEAGMSLRDYVEMCLIRAMGKLTLEDQDSGAEEFTRYQTRSRSKGSGSQASA